MRQSRLSPMTIIIEFDCVNVELPIGRHEQVKLGNLVLLHSMGDYFVIPDACCANEGVVRMLKAI